MCERRLYHSCESCQSKVWSIQNWTHSFQPTFRHCLKLPKSLFWHILSSKSAYLIMESALHNLTRGLLFTNSLWVCSFSQMSSHECQPTFATILGFSFQFTRLSPHSSRAAPHTHTHAFPQRLTFGARAPLVIIFCSYYSSTSLPFLICSMLHCIYTSTSCLFFTHRFLIKVPDNRNPCLFTSFPVRSARTKSHILRHVKVSSLIFDLRWFKCVQAEPKQVTKISKLSLCSMLVICRIRLFVIFHFERWKMLHKFGKVWNIFWFNKI